VTQSGFQEIPHTADWSLKVWAPNLSELLIQAVMGMNALMGVQINPQNERSTMFQVTGIDQESLLVSFLNRILYEMELNAAGYARFDLDLNGFALTVRASGGELTGIEKMVKAVTYHNIQIQSTDYGLVTTIVLDV